MEILEPEPPGGTHWATPGLLRDSFTYRFHNLVPLSLVSSLKLTIMCDSEAHCSPVELPRRTQRRTLIAASRKGIYFRIG